MNMPDIIYVPAFLEKTIADELLLELKQKVFTEGNNNKDLIKMPRLIKWYGDIEYAYSTIYHKAEKIPIFIDETMQQINIFLKEHKINSVLNSVLLNYYRNGSDKINYHSDDQSQIGQHPVIASLSLGDSRKFVLRHKTTKEKIQYELKHGDLFIMKGSTQDDWEHAILSEANKEVRINLTFRNTKYSAKIK